MWFLYSMLIGGCLGAIIGAIFSRKFTKEMIMYGAPTLIDDILFEISGLVAGFIFGGLWFLFIPFLVVAYLKFKK